MDMLEIVYQRFNEQLLLGLVAGFTIGFFFAKISKKILRIIFVVAVLAIFGYFYYYRK